MRIILRCGSGRLHIDITRRIKHRGIDVLAVQDARIMQETIHAQTLIQFGSDLSLLCVISILHLMHMILQGMYRGLIGHISHLAVLIRDPFEQRPAQQSDSPHTLDRIPTEHIAQCRSYRPAAIVKDKLAAPVVDIGVAEWPVLRAASGIATGRIVID